MARTTTTPLLAYGWIADLSTVNESINKRFNKTLQVGEEICGSFLALGSLCALVLRCDLNKRHLAFLLSI